MKIPVNEPIISNKAKEYVNKALNDGWISSMGEYIDRFETEFAKYLGVKYATTVSNGTTALHLALASLDIGVGDEVIVPDQTIISCPLAVIYTGATPVLVDVKINDGNIDPKCIEEKITAKTKAIMAVHLFGNPADMDNITAIAKKHNLFVIEDAAEAHGAEYKGKKVGSLSDVATFSFYANKIITTGEGGMLVTNNKTIYDKAVLMKNLAHTPGKRFFHEQIGYNYRMTNMQAALGLAHLEEIDHYLQKKITMAETYHSLLKTNPFLNLPSLNADVKNVFWMYNITVKDNSPLNRDQLMEKLLEKGVDTRTYFYPLHTQPVLKQYLRSSTATYPNSSKLSDSGFYLPSGLAITTEQIQYVAEAIQNIYS